MALPLFRILPLRPPKAPRLPAAPVEYERGYVDTLTSILRQYFNEIDNFAQPFTDSYGGAYLRFPNGAFHQDGTSTLTAAMTNVSTTPIQVVSTVGFPSSGSLRIDNELVNFTGKTSTTFTGITRGAYTSTNTSHAIGANVSEALGVSGALSSRSVPFTATDTSNGVALNSVDTSHIDFSIAGYYNIQFSAQLYNNTTTEDNVTFWFKKDGVDIPNSAGVTTVPKSTGSNTGAVIISWNIVVDVLAGGYIELYFASDTGNTVIVTYPAGTSPVHPVSPSVILTATFVSALYT
jgi:hypothetical protein